MKFPKVLLIDNDAFYINLHRLKLTAEGFVVEVARDGNEGLKKLSEFKPNIILLELAVPNLDGFGFLKKLSENPIFKNTPVIVLSQLTQESDVVRAQKLGVSRCFSKESFDFKTLSSEIIKLFKGPIVKKAERERERERENKNVT